MHKAKKTAKSSEEDLPSTTVPTAEPDLFLSTPPEVAANPRSMSEIVTAHRRTRDQQIEDLQAMLDARHANTTITAHRRSFTSQQPARNKHMHRQYSYSYKNIYLAHLARTRTPHHLNDHKTSHINKLWKHRQQPNLASQIILMQNKNN
jgi:hypothetical protein